MIELLDFVQIAGRVYQRTLRNRMSVPEGYVELQWQRDDSLTGFSAGVYKKGDEIVIGFTGSNEELLKDFAVARVNGWMPGIVAINDLCMWEAA